MLVETDAPFLTPMPYRGRPNGSYLIPLTVRALAEVTGTDLDDAVRRDLGQRGARLRAVAVSVPVGAAPPPGSAGALVARQPARDPAGHAADPARRHPRVWRGDPAAGRARLDVPGGRRRPDRRADRQASRPSCASPTGPGSHSAGTWAAGWSPSRGPSTAATGGSCSRSCTLAASPPRRRRWSTWRAPGSSRGRTGPLWTCSARCRT